MQSTAASNKAERIPSHVKHPSIKKGAVQHIRDISMDDIQKGKGFNSTSTYTGVFGDTIMLNTQQKLILDLPTTLADFFEYLTSCDQI